MDPAANKEVQDAKVREQQAVQRLYSESRRLGLLADPVVRSLLMSLLREFDGEYFRILMERVQDAQQADFISPDALQRYLPTEEEAGGETTLGTVVGTGYPYAIDPSDQAARHILVLGAAGYGKSYMIRKIMKALILSGTVCFAFSKKRDARSIASLYPDKVVHFRLTDQDFHYNPKEPSPGISLLQTNTNLCETFAQAEALLVGSGNYILSRLTELDEILGTTQDISRQASLFELREYIKRQRHPIASRESRFQESILNRLDGTLDSVGRMFACSHGLPIEEVLNDGQSVILEVDGVKEEIALFLTTSIMLRLFTWMLHSPRAKPRCLASFFDDSHELWNVNAERRTDESLPIMGLMASRFRVAGLIVASTQTPRLTSTLLRQNCATKVIFRQNDYEEALAAARSVGLDEKEAGELMRLKIGEAVCFKASYPYPVRVQISPDPEVDE